MAVSFSLLWASSVWYCLLLFLASGDSRTSRRRSSCFTFSRSCLCASNVEDCMWWWIRWYWPSACLRKITKSYLSCYKKLSKSTLVYTCNNKSLFYCNDDIPKHVALHAVCLKMHLYGHSSLCTSSTHDMNCMSSYYTEHNIILFSPSPIAFGWLHARFHTFHYHSLWLVPTT